MAGAASVSRLSSSQPLKNILANIPSSIYSLAVPPLAVRHTLIICNVAFDSITKWF